MKFTTTNTLVALVAAATGALNVSALTNLHLEGMLAELTGATAAASAVVPAPSAHGDGSAPETVACWKNLFDRSLALDSVCTGQMERSGMLCYAHCEPGYIGMGPWCLRDRSDVPSAEQWVAVDRKSYRRGDGKQLCPGQVIDGVCYEMCPAQSLA